jgi:hypothetical protein
MRRLIALLLLSVAGLAHAQPSQGKWKFLMPGGYHAGEAPIKPGKGWLALTTIDGSWHLVPTTVKAERIHDVVVDDAGGKTRIRISAESAGPIALFRLPNLTPRKAGAAETGFEGDANKLPPAIPLRLLFRGESHQLEAPKSEVYLRKGSLRTELRNIYVGGFDNEARLLWAGDLDGDGALDLLVQRGAYNSSGTCLSLSSGTRPGVLVRQIACHGGVGC